MVARRWSPSLLAVALSLATLACSRPDPQPAVTPSSPATPTATATPSTAPTPTAMPDTPASSPTPAATRELATFGGGCFWCTEAVLEQVDGVLDVTSGYAGGHVDAPTYQAVCTGNTGHAEVVQVTYDPSRIGYAELLDWFFRSHDPTTLNRQGPDEGTQYRSVVFTHSDAQHRAALAAIERAQSRFADPIVTQVSPAPRFWPAEDYHQDYFRRNPSQGYCRVMIAPKLQKLGLDTEPK